MVERLAALVIAVVLANVAALAVAAPAHGLDPVDPRGSRIAENRAAREPTPDVQMLLDLDLLEDAEFAKERDLLRRFKLLERLRLFESLHLLEGQAEEASGTSGAKR